MLDFVFNILHNFIGEVPIKKTPILVKFEELASFPIGEILHTHEGLSGELISVEGDNLHFRANMKKGIVLPSHYHDCTEFLLVFQGKLKDNESGKVISKARLLEIKPYTTHVIEAMEDTVFYMTFKKVR